MRSIGPAGTVPPEPPEAVVPRSARVPLIPGALAHLECEARDVIEAGDHAVFIGEVVGAEVTPGRPLLYFESGYQRLE